MTIKNFLSERLYLIIGIAIIISLFLPISVYIEQGTNNVSITSSFIVFIINSSTSGVLINSFSGPNATTYLIGPFSVIFLLLAMIGGVLLIITGLTSKDHEKIQSLLPGIGLSLSLFAILFWAQYLINIVESLAPFLFNPPPLLIYFYQDGTSFVYSGFGFGFWIGISAGSIGVIKYFFFNDKD